MNALNTTFGRYRLLEPLGRGGMAEVFKAKSYGVEGFEKVVVIKRILPELAESEQFVDMFIHEAKLAVRLSHANIVQVFDLGIAPADPPAPAAYYMAMEYVSGLDLATLLARCRRGQIQIPIEMAVYVAAEVAKGLDHAHRRRDEQNQPLGIVHLDVSPQNVLLSLEGEVKVTDFGIAKARGALENTDLADTRARQLQGKFGYMSPEHAAGDAVDARSDLFSLGTVLYEMLAGVNPFVAPTSFETLRRVQACEYPPVELLRPETPPELVALLKTAMSKSVDERFADAGRMYEALLAFLYAQGRRFSAHNLGEFLGGFRSPEETGQHVILDAEGLPSQERTPVEIPASRKSGHHKVETTLVDVTALGERREVTSLVVALAERDGANTDRVADTILRYGGRIVWREPESLSALFGVDDPDGRDTEIATRCALVVLRAYPGTSAGLHTGRIHVSSDSTPTEDERLTGLIATARDLSRVREGLCAISAAAMRQVRNLFVFDTLSSNERQAGVSATTTASQDASWRSLILVREVRGASEAVGRFVGRKDELRAVGEMLATATRRNACALTVRGDHGTGKTRLLLEVERRLRKGGYNVGFYLATCLPRGTEVPYSGLQCMLQVLCGITEGEPEPRIRQIIPRLRALGLPDDEVNAVLSVLGASGVGAKAALASGFRRMVQRLSEDRPHAFGWDAADCLDADSYAVLESVMSRANSARVLLLFASRAGYTHPIESTGLDLGDLKADDAEKLVAVRLGVERVPPELMRFVRDRAGGHPQMIEEVLKALVEARAVTVGDGSVVSMKLVGQDLALPKTLRGLVGSRITRLEAPERAVLQAAAVLGEPVNATVLARMMGVEMAALEKSLAILKDRGFLVHIGPVELQFTSPVVREVVVDALTAEAALAMHGAAGRALETEPGDHAGRVATHLYAAGERERAAGYFAKSAERRLAVGQYETSMRDFSRAIELCEPPSRSPSELADWLAGLAKAVRLVRSAPEAMEMCERVITRVDQGGDLEAKVTARIDAGRILGALHLYDAARAQFAGAEVIAQERLDLVKSALVAATELSGRQGDFKRSLAMLERLESIVTTGGDRAEEHKLVVSLVQTHAAMGDHAAATRHFDRLAALVKGDPAAECERHKLAALIAFFARDFRAAALHSEKAIDLARELGLQYEVAVNLHNLADILVHSSDFPRAYGAVQQSLALCDDLGFERLSSHNRMVLAYLDGLKGDTEADKVVLQGIRYAEANDFTWDVLGGRLLLAKLLEHRGDLDGARLGYQKLRELARGAGNRLVADECVEALRSMGAPPSQPPPSFRS